MTDHARSDKRYPSTQGLQVRCPSWADFAQLYAADVSDGGMFIRTDTPLPLMSEIDIELSLPEGHLVQLKATVVHVIDAQRAAREGRAPGVGVQFTDLDGPRKQQIQQLIDFSRWEGSTENRTSLATRLFETSVSVAPAELMQVLLSTPSPALVRGSKRAGSDAQAGQTLSPAHDASARPEAPRSTNAPAAGSRSVKARAHEGPSRPIAEAEVQTSQRPPDQAKLKLGISHLAHKHFTEAIKTFDELVQESGGSTEAQQWLLLARARACWNEGDATAAAEHYLGVLEIDESNREARKFVREHDTKKRLESLPFGRYFVKKS